jgi:putative permease
MFDVFRQWYQKYFSSEEIVVLLLLLVGGTLVISFLGQILAPLFTACVIAYLLQGLVSELLRHGMPKMPAIMLVYLLFLGLLVVFIFVLVPLSWSELLAFVEQQLPRWLSETLALLQKLPEQYPEILSQNQVDELMVGLKASANSLADEILSFSFSIIPNLLAILIFLVLVPVLVFFFLKDKDPLVAYVLSFLPEDRSVLSQIWQEMDLQVSNYVRGKFAEILIVGVVTYVALVILGVNYAVLLAVLVGLSVVIPFIGAAVVTVPVALVGYFQFGFGSEWATLMVVYGVIQALDYSAVWPL